MEANTRMELIAQIDHTSSFFDCFVRLPPSVCHALNVSRLALEIIPEKPADCLFPRVYCSWEGASSGHVGQFAVSAPFAQRLGLRAGAKYTVKAMEQPQPAQFVEVLPESGSIDWQVILLNACLPALSRSHMEKDGGEKK